MAMEIDKEMLDEFVAESKEHLETIEDDLLNLEKQKNNPDSELINKIFRAIHTIKGCAGFLGMPNINKLSHTMETLLSMMRNGEIKPELKYIDPLLEGVDMINSMIDNVEISNEMDISEIHNKLSYLLAGGVPSQVKDKLETNLKLSDLRGNDIGFSVSEFSLKNIPDDHYLYILKYDLIEFTKKRGKSPVTLIKYLLSLGNIVESQIETPANDLNNGLPEESLKYDVLYSSKIKPDEIANAIELNEGQVVRVNKDIIKDKCLVKIEKTKAEEPQTDSISPDKPALLAPSVESNDERSIAGVPVKSRKEDLAGTETIRINVDILDQLMMFAGELVLIRNQQLLNVDKSDSLSRRIVQRLDIVTSELQETVMRTRMQPMGNVFGKFTRVVRDLGGKLGKRIEIAISGNEVELDKTILESLADPLTHLIRNCCDHGIELPKDRIAAGKPEIGHISLSAYHEGGQINIEISDDGKGINIQAIKKKALEKQLKTEAELAQMSEKEIQSLILLPGFSTVEKVSDVSGRGVGMDVVKSNVEKLGGSIDIESTPGKWTRMHLRLPLTLAIIPCLIVVVGNYRYAIPQVNLVELVCLYDDEVRTKIECAGNKEVYRLRDSLLPMVRLSEVFGRKTRFNEQTRAEITEKHRSQQESLYLNPDKKASQSLNFAVLKIGSHRFGVIVDQVLGTEEIVVKPMHPALKSLGCYSGATVMGDGRVALILDIDGIARHAGIELNGQEAKIEDVDVKMTRTESQSVLIFKSGEEEQFAVALPLIKRIERINSSKIEKIGDKNFITLDGVSTLILKLDRFMEVSPIAQNEDMYLLLMKYINKPFGILISKLIDIEETSVELNEESYMADCLMGTSIVRDRITLFLDVYRLVERAEPSWFKNKNPECDPAMKKDILLVEDTPFFRQLVKGHLEADGYNVITANNGQIALSLLNESRFDLVVSDIEMPVMNGYDFIKNVRSNKCYDMMPAIALTALDSDEEKEKAKRLGFGWFQSKFNRESFLNTVKDALGSWGV